MTLDRLINEKREKLTESDLEILSYFVMNKANLIDKNIQDLATAIHVSKSTIVRLTQKLGFSGFAEFKFYLKNEQKDMQLPADNNMSLLEKDIQNTLSLIQQTNMVPLCKKIDTVKRVFVYGTDWGEKKAADDLVRNFMSCGIFMIHIPSVTELHWNINRFTSEDLIIFISFSGENKAIEKNITKLQLRKIPICSITPLHQNFLSSHADYHLYYQFTQLSLERDNQQEYNLFITLNILTDALFRTYLDYQNSL